MSYSFIFAMRLPREMFRRRAPRDWFPRTLRMTRSMTCRSTFSTISLRSSLSLSASSTCSPEELLVEVRERHGSRADLRREAPDLVLELAHVARILVVQERVHRLDVEARRRRTPVSRRERIEKRRNVLLAVLERREPEREGRESEVEVVAEVTVLDGARERTRARPDHAHVDGDRASAGRRDLARFEEPEEERLRRGRQVADFLDQEGAAVRLEETPGALASIARDRNDPDEFLFEGLRTRRRRGDVHERPIPPGERAWRVSATSVLPEPTSPMRRSGARAEATRESDALRFCSGIEAPTRRASGSSSPRVAGAAGARPDVPFSPKAASLRSAWTNPTAAAACVAKSSSAASDNVSAGRTRRPTGSAEGRGTGITLRRGARLDDVGRAAQPARLGESLGREPRERALPDGGDCLSPRSRGGGR